MLHKGDKYKCPFCDYTAKELAVIGCDFPVLKQKHVIGGGKRTGGCFNCGSIDRERLVYICLKDTLKIFETGKNKAILHIAPEANLSKKLLNFGFDKYSCGDLFTAGYTYPAHVQNVNILNIPFDDNTFDIVICNHVLEHIKPDLVAMKELRRVLKVGCQAILQVPISKNSAQTFENFSVTEPKQMEAVFGQSDHVRIYGQDYAQRLAEAGFTVSQINISKDYSEYGLNSEEDIYICTK